MDNEQYLTENYNEGELEKNIGNVLKATGYTPNTEDWDAAMIRWKRRRTSNPEMFKRFIEMN